MDSLVERLKPAIIDLARRLDDRATALEARIAEQDRLLKLAREALTKGAALMESIEQTSANVWWVNAFDPEELVCDTCSALNQALAAMEQADAD